MFTTLLEKVKNISKEAKITFLSTYIIGLIAHLYKLTNYLPNNDSVYSLYGFQNIIGSGRWFLAVVCGISSGFDIPLIEGILAVLYISIAAVFIVKLFNIKNPAVMVIIGGITVAFPSVTAIFGYGFTCDGYMLGMLMATLSVYLTRYENKSVASMIISGILLCLTCAIYQVYFSYAIVLILIYFIYQIMCSDKTAKEHFIYIVKEACKTIISFAIYYGIWKILLIVEKTNMNSYMGIDKAGISINSIIQGLEKSIPQFLFFIFESNLSFSRLTVYCVSGMFFIGLLALTFVIGIIKNKIYKSAGKLLLLAAAIIGCFPCVFMWNLVGGDTVYSARMLAPLSLFYILAVILAEQFFKPTIKNIAGVLSVVFIINYSYMANIYYLGLQRAFTISKVEATEMLDVIHDYENEYEIENIAFIGRSGKSYPIQSGTSPHSKTDYQERICVLPVHNNLIFDNNHAYLFLSNYCGLNLNGVDNEIIKEKYDNHPDVVKLEEWPSPNSITVIDNTLIIKLSNDNPVY